VSRLTHTTAVAVPAALHAGLGGWTCRIEGDTPETAARLRRIFSRYLAPEAPDTATSISVSAAPGELPRLRIANGSRPYRFQELFGGPEWKRFAAVGPDKSRYVDTVLGGEVTLDARGEELVVSPGRHWPLYAMLGFLALLLRETETALLHAAVCAARGRSLLLVGPSGAGKSTLAAALDAEGALYHTDEAAFFVPPGYRLHVPYRALALRPGGAAALGLDPAENEWYEIKPGDRKKSVALPEPCAVPPEDAVLCFLDGFAAGPVLRPASAREAVRRLVRSLSLGDRGLAARLETAAALAERFPAWLLTAGPPRETARMLLAHLQG
jgi:hypothetical protein